MKNCPNDISPPFKKKAHRPRLSLFSDQENTSLSLAPEEEFREDQQKTMSAVAVLDIACSAISTQPLFEVLEGVPDLQKHQERSKSIAENWRANVRPVLFRVNETIINFSIEFNAFFDPLMEFAEQLSDPTKSKEAQANLIEGLIALMDVLKDQRAAVENAKDNLNALQKDIFENESDLNADLNLIEATYEGDTGKLSDLKNLVQASEAAMSRDLTLIGGGAVAGVIGGLTVAVGVFMWVETLGGSTPVIVAGLAIAGSGITAASYGIYDYNKSSLQKAEAIRDISKISKEIALTNVLKGSVSGLITHLEAANQALDKLAGAWGQLERDYDNLISALQKTEGNVEKTNPLSFIVKANLNASKDHWNILKSDAQIIKDNLLAPLKMDTQALDNSDRKNPSLPDIPTESPNKVQRVLLHSAAPQTLSIQSFSAISEQGYKEWLESTTQSLLGFSSELSALASRTTLPKEVAEDSDNLRNLSSPALVSVDHFLATNEALSGKGNALRQTAKLEDAEIVAAAHQVLDDALAIAGKAQSEGQEAAQKVLLLDNAVDKIDASLLRWLQQMQDEKSADESRLDDAVRFRKDAEKKKNDLKKHFWACLAGPIPCAIVALEAGIRIKNAQSDIDTYSKTIASLDKSLAALLNTVNSTTSLTVNAAALGKSIDGGLKAIQTIVVTIEGLRNSESLTPFVLRAHLQALAGQIEGISTLRLAKSATLLHTQVRQTEKSSDAVILEYLQQLFVSALLIQNSSAIISKQPALNNTENLLKQNQALLRNHSLEWFTKTHQHVLSQFSTLGAIGKEIAVLGSEVQKRIKENNSEEVVRGLEALADSFNSYWGTQIIDGALYKSTLKLTLFNQNIRNDQAAFVIVDNIIRNQFEGDLGQLALLEQNEKEYTEAIQESLEDLIYNSTRVIGEHLIWAVVLGISIGVGQIEFAAAEAPTVMYLIKKGTNISVKKASEVGSAAVKSKISNIERKGENVGEFIEKRSENLKELSLLKSDISILKVLVNDVDVVADNSKMVLDMLDKIKTSISRDIDEFNLIKYMIRAEDKSKAEERLNTLIEKWANINTLTHSLEQSYLESQFLPDPSVTTLNEEVI